ncbi:TPA: hypothetical protein ACIAGS_005043 [Escherichia coli]
MRWSACAGHGCASGTDSLLKGYIPEKSGHNAKAHGGDVFSLEGLSLDFFDRALPVVAIREMARR